MPSGRFCCARCSCKRPASTSSSRAWRVPVSATAAVVVHSWSARVKISTACWHHAGRLGVLRVGMLLIAVHPAFLLRSSHACHVSEVRVRTALSRLRLGSSGVTCCPPPAAQQVLSKYSLVVSMGRRSRCDREAEAVQPVDSAVVQNLSSALAAPSAQCFSAR